MGPAVTAEPLTWRNIGESDFYVPVPEPVHLGPTWQRNTAWDGVDPLGEFVLPRWSLGWQVARWVSANLLNDEGAPFILTFEQVRFLLWWYAVDAEGRFVYRQGVLQRLKGWGKDPFAAVLAAVELVGPCRFAGWATKDMADLGVQAGEPVARSNPRAWVQVAAVSREQTKNTMTIFGSLFTDECKAEHSIDIGKEIIYAYAGQRRIEAVTSSPKALEGNRPSLVIANETHHWVLANKGLEMNRVIRRNLAKGKGGTGRVLAITNAFEDGEESVAERRRKTYEAAMERGVTPEGLGVLYDSIEASPKATLALPQKGTTPEGEPIWPSEDEVKAYIGAVIDAVRGDASWLDVDRLVGEILDEETTPAEARRFYFNQSDGAEDAWLDPVAITRMIDPAAEELARTDGGHRFDSRWIVGDDEDVVLFFDGGKSDDSTALVGCRLSDGHVFTVGIWQRPSSRRRGVWRAPREEVDERFRYAMKRFKVVGAWADPSHAKDDETGSFYWDAVIDGWHRDFHRELREDLWAVRGSSGGSPHSIMWDMTSPARTEHFIQAAERFIAEAEALNDVEEIEPSFTIDGHPFLVSHLRNARRRATRWGTTLGKASRGSQKKIDSAVCAVGARMLRRVALNARQAEAKTGWRVHF